MTHFIKVSIVIVLVTIVFFNSSVIENIVDPSYNEYDYLRKIRRTHNVIETDTENKGWQDDGTFKSWYQKGNGSENDKHLNNITPNTSIATTKTTTISFMDKLKGSVDINNDKQDPLNEEYINLKSGWTSIKKDKLTNNLIIVIKPSLYIETESESESESESEMGYEVLNALCDLHERRTAHYIEEYGYDTWEKTFRYPNYDYDCVDKLDEKYEAEM